jgi:preprotein translocase subunit SecG
MTFLLGLLSVVAFVSSALLMVVVLLQEPKGGGIASALGGSGMEAVGVSTGSVNKFTSWVAAIWVAACLMHSLAMPAANQIETSAEEGANTPADTSTPGGGEAPAPGNGTKDGG